MTSRRGRFREIAGAVEARRKFRLARLLQEDPTLSVEDLAQRMGLSQAYVATLIKIMFETGLLRGSGDGDLDQYARAGLVLPDGDAVDVDLFRSSLSISN